MVIALWPRSYIKLLWERRGIAVIRLRFSTPGMGQALLDTPKGA